MPPQVDHVFVLMLENRSFDHLFGFSGISGIDAAAGTHTVIDGLTGQEANSLNGKPYSVTRGAAYAMSIDPGHEFGNVLDQLCGPGVRYTAPYPKIDNSGFVGSYQHKAGSADPGEIMRCFDTSTQLPVLYALAREYAICDRWFASMPGPTWPNRMFVHAASSGGLDHSPTTAEIVEWETVDGFEFPNGDIFRALKKKNKRYHLYSGDEFPMVAALKGITLFDVDRIDDLVSALSKSTFSYSYVFIEPSYNILHDFRNSSCQHPLADVRDGEALVKKVYEALRASKIWEKSLLLILWDEHGGFYDHVAPPSAVSPGDGSSKSKYNQSGFTFRQYGVRTPALVISPHIPRNTIDHREYDHASVPATLEALFGLSPLTVRDGRARNVLSLLSLEKPRAAADTLDVLPTPEHPPSLHASTIPKPMDAVGKAPASVVRGEESVNDGSLPTIVHAALRQQIQLHPDEKSEILAKVAGLRTRADAVPYLARVQSDLRIHRQSAGAPARTERGARVARGRQRLPASADQQKSRSGTRTRSRGRKGPAPQPP